MFPAVFLPPPLPAALQRLPYRTGRFRHDPLTCMEPTMTTFLRRSCLLILGLAALAGGPGSSAEPEARRTEVGKNVVLEIKGKERRVIVQAVVCLREGPLEGLLTRMKAKEHEYILAADCDARHVHAALLAAGGKK